MPFIVGCSKGKHKDYQVWGSESNCMKKMKKCSSFKEWINEFEIVFNESLYDRINDLDYLLELPQLENEPVTKELIKKLFKLHLTTLKKSNTVEDVKEKMNARTAYADMVKKLPHDIKAPFLNLVKDGNLGNFMDSLSER